MTQITPQGNANQQAGRLTTSDRQVDNRVGVYADANGSYPNYPQFDVVADDGGFDFYRYLRILTKYKNLIAGFVITALAIAATVTYLITPTYRATVSIQVDREAMKVVKLDNPQPDDVAVGGAEFYQTQYELLASRSLAERVVSNSGLINNQSFNAPATSLTQMILGLLTGNHSTDANAALSPDEKQRLVTDQLLRDLIIAPVRGSKIVHLSIDHSNREIAQRLANNYAEAFIADNLDRRFDATSYARKFLEDRLQQLKVKLEDSERLLVKYAQDQGIINVDDNKSLSASDMVDINTKLAEARSDRIKKELLWKQAQSTKGLGLKEILDSPSIQENLKLRAQLEGDYQLKLATFKPSFPTMLELQNKIIEINRHLLADADAVKQSIHASYMTAKSDEEQLQTMLEQSKAQVVDMRGRSIQYNILKREVDTNRTLYDGLLQRYKEIGVAGGVGTNNISIVDKAPLPRFPRSPIVWLNLLVALIIGLLIGCLVALGLDYLDDSFKAPEDIERELGVTVIGVIPKTQLGTDIDTELADSRSAISESYRSLRTGLQFSTSEGLPRTLLLTSSKPGEGKTTTSVNLARMLAGIGLRVLLIDGDLRKARLHKVMNATNEIGLSNYLTGAKTAEEVVQATSNEKLLIMTSGPLPPNPAELLAGGKFAALLSLAAESFDMVLIDGPPIMGLADAPIISNFVHSTVVVVAANDTRRNVLRASLRRLKQSRANMIGAILNKFDVKLTGYGYGYGYGEYEYYSYGQDLKSLTDHKE